MVTMERIRWSLPLSECHPAAHGGLMLDLQIDDEVVRGAEPIAGRLHRGAEKLFESRDYRSALALANRHDWFGSVSSEVGLASLVERFLGIEVPVRARWLRTLLMEYARIAHHLLWLTATLEALERGQQQPQQLGRPGSEAELISTATAAGHRARRGVLDVVESYAGARMHQMVTTIGGTRVDYGPRWLGEVTDTLATARRAAAHLREVYALDPHQLAGLAPVPASAARDFGVSGPVARASGAGFDLRLDRADDCYRELLMAGALRRVVAAAGDAQTRFLVLADQVAVSADCVQACVARLAEYDPKSAINVPLPRSIRLPEGAGYAETENPGGINGWYLESRGGTHPHRLKLRTASFNNVQTLQFALPGTPMAHLPAALFSFFLVAGDTDK